MESDSCVAVCLFGQMRSYKRTFKKFDRNVLSRFNPDVFVHTWRSPGSTWKRTYEADTTDGLVSQEGLAELYSPVDMRIEEFEDRYYNKLGDVTIPEKMKYLPDWKKGMLPMFYKMKECNRLKSEAESRRGEEYDMVMLCRPDLLIDRPLPQKVIENTDMLWTNYKAGMEYWVDDRIVVSSSANIDYYTSVWEKLNQYWKTELGEAYGPLGYPEEPSFLDHMGIPERVVHYHMERSDIETRKFGPKFQLIRQDDIVSNSTVLKGLHVLRRDGLCAFLRESLDYVCNKKFTI